MPERDPLALEALLAELDDFILRLSCDHRDVTEAEYLEVVDGALQRQRYRAAVGA